MTDRELLELAAIAIGERVVLSEAEMHGCTDESTIYTGAMLYGVQDVWNPLADDGDALRLAVKLGVIVGCYENYSSLDLLSPYAHIETVIVWHSSVGNCQYGSTRRAIVLAAAEIGKKIKDAAPHD